MATYERQVTDRILRHQRIFQSVFNDLRMRHEIVRDSKDVQRYAYVYDGVDPYELDGTKQVDAALEGVEKYRIEANKQLLDAILQALPEELHMTTRTVGSIGSYNEALSDVRNILNEARK